jgi:hypothetical protein
MLKNIILLSTAFAVLSTPATATTRHRKHHQSKLEKQLKHIVIPVAGGAGGYAIAGPIGAAVGAGAGYIATHHINQLHSHRIHSRKGTARAFPGYRYSNGYYYDGYGNRYTLNQLLTSAPGGITSRNTQVPAYPGFTYSDGYYRDDYGHSLTLDQMEKQYGHSSYRQRVKSHHMAPDHGTGTPPPYKFAEKYGTYIYRGFSFHDGVYWDQDGHWYAPSYMYRYYGPAKYQKRRNNL